MKLYLDIDGVLLTTKNTQPAEYANEFINYITKHFDCYWLTTHCKGDTSNVLEYLSKYFSSTTIDIVRCIKPTNWDTLKTEAINISEQFVWLDDRPFFAEIEILKQYNCENSLIKVNINNKDELKRIIEEYLIPYSL